MEIHIENDPSVAGSGTDRSALWTLLAILFFGAFIILFVLIMQSSSWTEPAVTEPAVTEPAVTEPVSIPSDETSKPDTVPDSTTQVPAFPPSTPPVTWEGEENTPMGP